MKKSEKYFFFIVEVLVVKLMIWMTGSTKIIELKKAILHLNSNYSAIEQIALKRHHTNDLLEIKLMNHGDNYY